MTLDPKKLLMVLTEMSSYWNEKVRDLYRYSNQYMGVSSSFTERVLTEDLSNPYMYYNQTGAKLLLWVELENEDEDEELIAMVGIVPCNHLTAEIQRLTVHPRKRRQGLGRKMMELVHQIAIEELNYDNYIFNCLETNEVALKFYQTLPFVKETHRIDHYSYGDQPTYTLVYFESVVNYSSI